MNQRKSYGKLLAALCLLVSSLGMAMASHSGGSFTLFRAGSALSPAEPAGSSDTVRASADTARAVHHDVAPNPKSVIDEVVWIVGDEPIMKSDVEMTRMQYESEGVSIPGNPDCSIPEQLAVQKLFLHQAALDSIQVTESQISREVDQRINYWIQIVGSKEKLEEYRRKSVSQLREEMHDDVKNGLMVQQMRENLVKDIKVTPSQVRNYFRDVPADSIPMIPTEVEVEIITNQPHIPQAEIDRVKNELREYTDRINKGEISFSTLARLYSEDPGSARNGGELDYVGRGMLDPAFATVAFNLTDPNRISKIVESEYGFHIIQLIDRRGDKIKVRHILRKPVVPQESIDKTVLRMDSIYNDIRAGKFSFEEAASFLSDDKDTRSNKGLMANTTEEGRTSRFQMKDLPTEVARVVDTMKVGEISRPFSMVNSKGKTVCAILKLKSRVDSHRASVTEDFQKLKNVVLQKEKEKKIESWLADKIKHTYVKMSDQYKDCKFQYQGWIK